MDRRMDGWMDGRMDGVNEGGRAGWTAVQNALVAARVSRLIFYLSSSPYSKLHTHTHTHTQPLPCDFNLLQLKQLIERGDHLQRYLFTSVHHFSNVQTFLTSPNFQRQVLSGLTLLGVVLATASLPGGREQSDCACMDEF